MEGQVHKSFLEMALLITHKQVNIIFKENYFLKFYYLVDYL
jgi:hypothetical protein